MEASTIRIGPSSASTSCIRFEIRRNLKTCGTWLIPAWRHLNDLPVDQFRFALHFVQILYRSAYFDTHSCLLLLCAVDYYTLARSLQSPVTFTVIFSTRYNSAS